MKTYTLKVRTASGSHTFTALARNGAEALMLAWDQFPGESLTITIRGGRA